MMDWTDRHCRVLHRRFSRRTLLYTEMITAMGIVRGDPERMLRHSADEQPLALQLGGSDPDELAAAVRIALDWGFAEINLNIGCPSDRVRKGAFGACLMREPALVAECVAAMGEAAGPGGPEITVKCRIGVDEQEPRAVLPAFLDTVAAAGRRSFAIHARKAWLQGLSTRENRDIPPLDYPLVGEMKQARPDLEIIINGGITSLDQAEGFLSAGLDGVMIGRAAYHSPADILASADQRIFGEDGPAADPVEVALGMIPYIEAELASGARLHHITRHMLSIFSGRRGAKQWRRTLSEGVTRPGAGSELITEALRAVAPGACAA